MSIEIPYTVLPSRLRAQGRHSARTAPSGSLTKWAYWALNPVPLRARLARRVVRALDLGSYADRIAFDIVERPHYAFCMYNAAILAARLGRRRISVIEFGVAGGNGLLALEDHAQEIERETGVTCDIYGFDTGKGLPAPTDWRDLPYMWKEGFYDCDVDRLRRRLKRARLILGDVAETVNEFLAYRPAPIGSVMVDLDLYSSTKAALKLFAEPSLPRLPRIFCYLDDITGQPVQAYNEFTGELLAIKEFNRDSPRRKFARLDLGRRAYPADWNDRIYVLHSFDHRDYGAYVGPKDDQRPLRER